MFSVKQLAQAAKLFFPNKADTIDQAVNMAQSFSPSKDGVAQLMAKYGKRKEDLQGMVKLLDNPLAQRLMSRFPGLEGALRGAANEVQGGEAVTMPQGTPPNIPQSPAAPSSTEALAARLARLK